MDSKIKRQLTKRVNDIYSFCISGITKMPTLESKRFSVKLALEIHSLLNWEDSLLTTQTNQPAQPLQDVSAHPAKCLLSTSQQTVQPETIIQQSISVQTQQIFSFLFSDKPITFSVCQSESSLSEHSVSCEYASDNQDPQLAANVAKFNRFMEQREKEMIQIKQHERELNEQIQFLKKQNMEMRKELVNCKCKLKQQQGAIKNDQKYTNWKIKDSTNKEKDNEMYFKKIKYMHGKEYTCASNNKNKNKKKKIIEPDSAN